MHPIFVGCKEIFKKLLTNNVSCGIIYKNNEAEHSFSPGAIERKVNKLFVWQVLSCVCFAEIVSSQFFILSVLEVFCIGTAKELSVNEEIRAAEIRVVDEDGSQLGIMKTQDAKKLAFEKGLDLVEIAPGAEPPVCRIMDFGKFRFEKEKKQKEAKKKQQKIDIKEIQLSCRIDTHDFETKLNHARKFLTSGNKVKVSVRFKGREMNHTSIGLEVINKLGEACTDIGIIEKPAVLDGRQMLMFLAPKNASAKPKKEKQQREKGEDEE